MGIGKQMFKIIFYMNDDLINMFVITFTQSILVLEYIKIYFRKKDCSLNYIKNNLQIKISY